MALQVGQILLNRYRIVRLLAQGGFGTVYRAWDLQQQCPCAVKENLDLSVASQKQFTREADMLMGLSHPNLPRVYTHFDLPGQGQFLVMDFIEGENLEVMRSRNGGALNETAILPWMEQVMDALEYLHSQNPPIIHRDVKPANICITPQGKAVLVDFGIAKQSTGHTTIGARAVTPGFSPPEQYAGGQGTDARSDIYALGATLFTVLTGIELPESINRMMAKTGTQPPHMLAPGIQTRVSNAVMKAIQTDPDQRFASIDHFRAAVFGTVLPNTTRLPWLHRTVLAVGAMGALGIFGVVGIVVAALLLINPPRDAAPTATQLAQQVLVIDTQQVPVTNTQPPVYRNTQTVGDTQMATIEAAGTQIAQPSPTSRSAAANPASTRTPAVPAPSGMVYIPAGQFWIGATQQEMNWHLNSCNRYANCAVVDYEDMMPRHQVSLSAYFIDTHEVTNGEYQRCVQAGKCAPPRADRIEKYLERDYADNPANDSYPVVAISWADAQDFCQWDGGKRLPTEAEWERAARGAEDYFYPWLYRPSGTLAQDVFGSTVPLANFCDNGCPMENWDDTRLSDGWIGPSPVGSYPSGPYGLYDMAGNVTEWIQDVYAADYYANSPLQNPVNEAPGPWRITRGGGWNNGIYAISALARSAQEPNDPKAFIGFRCVKPAPDLSVDGAGVKMVKVPAGSFIRGSDVETAQAECQALYAGGSCEIEEFEDEIPSRTIVLDDFWIDQTEVTNAMYADCVDAGGCSPPDKNQSNGVSNYYPNSQYANYPVLYVSWPAAQNYCQWRGARLPSEAEWEKAARGTGGNLYPWGNTFQGNLANFCDTNCPYDWALQGVSDGYADTAPVGSYPLGASLYGAYDLAGNVWEWTADWYSGQYYASARPENPPGPESGTERVLRGGAWNCVGSILRGATRLGEDPNGTFFNVGFRCAKDG